MVKDKLTAVIAIPIIAMVANTSVAFELINTIVVAVAVVVTRQTFINIYYRIFADKYNV